MLARKLQWLKERSANSLIVLAIPRGGVVTGEVIAQELRVGLDVIVAKKLGDPLNPEFAIDAVMHDGSFVPNEDVTSSSQVSNQYIDESILH